MGEFVTPSVTPNSQKNGKNKHLVMGPAGGEFFFPKQVYLLLRESDLHQDHRYQT